MIESMEKMVALCKNRGYIYPGSEIYGGLANTWDYGPKEHLFYMKLWAKASTIFMPN